MDVELLQRQCNKLLIGMVGESLLERWWSSYNKAFNQTPKEQFSIDPTSVYKYLLKCAEGEW